MMLVVIKKCRCWLLAIAVLTLSGCGFHLQHTAEIPEQFKTLTFHSNDPYGPLSREVKTVLKNNQVTLVDDISAENIPGLRLIREDFSKKTISIYQDGKAAEYQLSLTVDAQVIISGEDIYPITVRIFRTFFDNPETALAKDTEQTLIRQEMYEQAAQQIVRKLKSVSVVDKKLNTNK